MKLVLFNDYRLGVIRHGEVVDAMDVLGGIPFRRPHDVIDEVISRWDELRPQIEAVVSGKDGVPIDSVRLRPPVPKPPKILCAAINYLEFGQREPAEVECFFEVSHCSHRPWRHLYPSSGECDGLPP